jgi:hypothetical protein
MNHVNDDPGLTGSDSLSEPFELALPARFEVTIP